MLCRIRRWHRKTECENTDKLSAAHLKSMNSDLFHKHGRIPPAQQELMTRNASESQLLRLPPEIRLRIYKHVLGGQKVFVSRIAPESICQLNTWGLHHGGGFRHTINVDRSARLDIRLLRVCRQIFAETALLPYALNHFTFEKETVRRAFERRVRPGKKLVQKKAIGDYDVMDWEDFQNVLVAAYRSDRKAGRKDESKES